VTTRRFTTGLLIGLAGLGLGAAGGLLVGELMGGVSRERVGRGLRRLRRGEPTPEPSDARTFERAVLHHLRADSTTRRARVRVRALGGGAVELVGWVPSEQARLHAERVARRAPGVRAVVNRTLVHGVDDQPTAPVPSDAV
jgi:hypothetical protein